jgi:hypothetical protein
MTIDATTAQKGEREEALMLASAIVAAAEAYPINGSDAEKIAALDVLIKAKHGSVKVARALLSSAKAEGEMREALAFYADARRYNGPNQNNPGNDPHTPEDAPYLTDVTRDCGKRARAALKEPK